jgi:hypothetical protein
MAQILHPILLKLNKKNQILHGLIGPASSMKQFAFMMDALINGSYLGKQLGEKAAEKLSK